VHGIVARWVNEYPTGFPPIVLHITDGESGDGDPTAAGTALMNLATSDGNALVFTCHLSSTRATKIEYPAHVDGLPDTFAKTLFGISSVLPPEFSKAAKELGLNLPEGARGFVFNADATSLVHFFDIGTRPANRKSKHRPPLDIHASEDRQSELRMRGRSIGKSSLRSLCDSGWCLREY
jgi:hypothetical protein